MKETMKNGTGSTSSTTNGSSTRVPPVLERLRILNPRLAIRDLADPLIARFARLVPGDFSSLIELADRLTGIEQDGNRYVASMPELEKTPAFAQLSGHFGLADIQIGWCNGPNSRLNAVEWHKSAEIDIAVTDLVLILGAREDIDERGTIDSSRLSCFFLPKGAALELLPETLHFAPCKVSHEGFKSIIVLPRGTNEALPANAFANGSHAQGQQPATVPVPESRFLFMKNKWLIAHPERLPLVQKGAFPGITGENTEILI